MNRRSLLRWIALLLALPAARIARRGEVRRERKGAEGPVITVVPLPEGPLEPTDRWAG